MTDWINGELSGADFGDERLTKRFIAIATRFASTFGNNISSSFSNWKDIKAAYRFFSNRKVKVDNILAPHIKETLERSRDHDRVFLIQDTTYFNFSDRPKTEGLDITQRSKLSKEAQGLMLHNTLAVSEDGVPLGLIDQHFIDRKELHGNNFEEKRSIRNWNNCINEKESVRWINTIKDAEKMDFGNTQVIHIADREADIYELYRDAVDIGANFLIRAARNRSINKANRREPPSTYLFDYLTGKRAQGKLTIDLQVNGKEKFRDAHLSIIYTKIAMPAPPNKTRNKDGELPIIELSAIMAIERSPPAEHEGLCWVLLTDLPVNTFDEAVEKIQWYKMRWQIELYHKVLKSGCGVEKAQLRDAQRLKNYIVLKSIIAWRLFWLSRSYKNNKDNCCLEILSKDEWMILYRKMHNGKKPKQTSTIGEVVTWIAKLGGYIGRNTDPPPGMISLWRGWQRLMDMVEDYSDICG